MTRTKHKNKRKAFSGLVLSLMLTQRIQSVPADYSPCFYLEKRDGVLANSGGKGSAQAIAMELKCPPNRNKFRISFWYSPNQFPTAPGQYQVLFSYHWNIRMTITPYGNFMHIAVIKEGEGLVNAVPLVNAKWTYIFYEISQTKSELVVRSSERFDLEPQYKDSHTNVQPFTTHTNPVNNRIYFGKDWAANEEAYNGYIYRYMITCDTIGIENFQFWRILFYSYVGHADLVNYFDFSSQEFVNLISPSKNPISTRGMTEQVEATDPELVTDHYEIKNGQFFNIPLALYESKKGDPALIKSIIMKIKIHTFPDYGVYEPILQSTTDRTIQIQVNWKGEFRIYADENHWFSIRNVQIQAGVETYLRIYESRANLDSRFFPTHIFHQCFYMVAVGTTDLPKGGHIKCYESTKARDAQIIWSYFKVGGSQVAGGKLNFEVQTLHIFSGYVEFRKETETMDCKNNPTSSGPTKLEFTPAEIDVAVECNPGFKLFIKDKNIFCSNQATTGFANRPSFYSNSIYDVCEARKYVDGSGTCQACSQNNCVACPNNACTGCDTVNNWSIFQGNCHACDVGNFVQMWVDVCYDCKDVNDTPCQTCTDAKCDNIVCSATETFAQGHCCDIHHGKTWDGNNCVACVDPACKSCRAYPGGGNPANLCGECKKGYALRLATRTCIPNCDGTNGYFFDFNIGECAPCSEGCLECVKGDYCFRCQAFDNYYLKEDLSCGRCKIGDGQYMDTKYYNPPACLECLANCALCKDEFTCDLCDDFYYVAPDKKSCIYCDPAQGKTLNTLVSPRLCRTCHASCGMCKIDLDPNSCSTCANGFYMNEDGVSCQVCDLDGKFRDEGFCRSCHPNCKRCSSSYSTGCLECYSTGSLIYLREATGECVSSCSADGLMLDGVICKDCHSTCKKCSQKAASNACTECYGTKKVDFQTNVCKECSSDEYEDGNYCKKCDPSCLTCSAGDTKSCLTCAPGLFLKLNLGQNGECLACNTDGVYKLGNQCIDCHPTCKRCSSSKLTDCLECDTTDSLFLKPGTNPGEKICVSCDKEGQVREQGNCNTCHVSCKRCSGSNDAFKCTECSDGYLVGVDGSCINCPNGSINKQTNLCVSEAECNLKNENEFCVDKCDQGYGLEDSTAAKTYCVGCGTNCEACSDGICSVCSPPKGLKNGVCAECSETEYSKQGVCVACEGFCSKCKNLDGECYECPKFSKLNQEKKICECIPGTILNPKTGKSCEISCSEKEIFKEGQGCLKCPEGCDECQGDDMECVHLKNIRLGGSILKKEEFTNQGYDLTYKVNLFDSKGEEVPPSQIIEQTPPEKLKMKALQLEAVYPKIDLESHLIWDSALNQLLLGAKYKNSSKLQESGGETIKLRIKINSEFLEENKKTIKFKLAEDQPSQIEEPIKKNPISDPEVAGFKEENKASAETVKSTVSVMSSGAEVGAFASSVSSLGSMGFLVMFAQSSKLISRLRLLAFDFGMVLEQLLELIAQSFDDTDGSEPVNTDPNKKQNSGGTEGGEANQGSRRRLVKASETRNKIYKISANTYHGKLSTHRVLLFMTSKMVMLLKMLIYLLSYVVKMVKNHCILPKIRKQKKFKKNLVRIVKYSGKIHFALFNVLVVDVVFFGTRTILHAQITLHNLASYILVVIVYVLCVLDCLELAVTAVKISKRAKKSLQRKLELKEVLEYRRVGLDEFDARSSSITRKGGIEAQSDLKLSLLHQEAELSFIKKGGNPQKDIALIKRNFKKKKDSLKLFGEKTKGIINQPAEEGGRYNDGLLDLYWEEDLKKSSMPPEIAAQRGFHRKLDFEQSFSRLSDSIDMENYLINNLRDKNDLHMLANLSLLLNNGYFIFRIMVYKIVLVAVPQIPKFQLWMLISTEVFHIAVTFKNFIEHGRTLTWGFFIARSVVTFLFVGFEANCLVILNWNRSEKPVPVIAQKVAYWIIMTIIGIEITFVVYNVGVLALGLFKKKKKVAETGVTKEKEKRRNSTRRKSVRNKDKEKMDKKGEEPYYEVYKWTRQASRYHPMLDRISRRVGKGRVNISAPFSAMTSKKNNRILPKGSLVYFGSKDLNFDYLCSSSRKMMSRFIKRNNENFKRNVHK